MIKVISKSESETIQLAEKIGKLIFPGTMLLLTGDLGAGKTAFVRGLAIGMGYKGLVKSPSYTIMNIYDGDIPLIHFDLYRLVNEEDFYQIGAEEYLNNKNVCAVEWHQCAKDALGDSYLEVIIKDIGKNNREITLLPFGKRYENWLSGIKNDINS